MASVTKSNNKLHIGNGPGEKTTWYGKIADIMTGEDKYIVADDVLDSSEMSVDAAKLPADTYHEFDSQPGPKTFGCSQSYFIEYWSTPFPRKTLISGGYNLTCVDDLQDAGDDYGVIFGGLDASLKPIMFRTSKYTLYNHVFVQNETPSSELEMYEFDLTDLDELNDSNGVVPSYITNGSWEIGQLKSFDGHVYIYFKI